jgi:hypothetical protein
MAGVQTTEVDVNVAPVNVGPWGFYMLIDLERMSNFYEDNFCEKQKAKRKKSGRC